MNIVQPKSIRTGPLELVLVKYLYLLNILVIHYTNIPSGLCKATLIGESRIDRGCNIASANLSSLVFVV